MGEGKFWPDPTLTGPPRYFGLLNKTHRRPTRRGLPVQARAPEARSRRVPERQRRDQRPDREYPDLLLAALCVRARFARFDKARLTRCKEGGLQNLKRSVVGVETAEGTSSFEAGTNVEQA